MLNGALPPFDLQSGLALVGVRAVWVGALLSAAGTLAVLVLVAPAALRRAPEAATALPGLDRLARGSLLAALLAGLGWLALQAAALGDATSLAEAAALIPTVLAHTRFGHVLALQWLAVVGSLLLASSRVPLRRPAAALLTAAAAGLQAGHGHATAMGDPVLLAADTVHLLAAAGWIGGLVPLLLLVRNAPPPAGAAAARAFADLGRVCLLALIGSAAFQAWTLVGGGPGLLGTAYGWVALLKMLAFAALTWFAARNRYRLAPALRRAEPGPGPGPAQIRLVRSIATQTGFGLAAIAAAAVLTALPPAIHVQPVWPFTLRPSPAPAAMPM